MTLIRRRNRLFGRPLYPKETLSQAKILQDHLEQPLSKIENLFAPSVFDQKAITATFAFPARVPLAAFL
jgi:hypothetical protein